MKRLLSHVLVVAALLSLSTTAFADDDDDDDTDAEDSEEAASVEEDQPKQPRRGDFDAGGQLRFPNGPDEMGEYATFNWVGLDAKGKYFLLDSVTIGGNIPLAAKKPETFGGADARLIGGMTVTLDARLPKMPWQSETNPTEVGLLLSGGYMREGAMLLSERDFPAYIGDFQPGFSTGPRVRIVLSSLLDVSTAPLFVYQSGDMESLTALQFPAALIVKLGEWIKVSADVGLYTGDDFSLGGDDGGRLATGAALDLKFGPILLHAGAGAASLITGDAFYPSVGDSLYLDFNVKYAK